MQRAEHDLHMVPAIESRARKLWQICLSILPMRTIQTIKVPGSGELKMPFLHLSLPSTQLHTYQLSRTSTATANSLLRSSR
jgi:hypothetical protein